MAIDALTPEQEIHRANDAKFLLNHPTLKETLDDIERATIQRWEMAETKESREDFWRLYKVAKLFRQALQSQIETGLLAENHLDQLKQRESIWQKAARWR